MKGRTDWNEEWEGLRQQEQIIDNLSAAGWHCWPADSSHEERQGYLEAWNASGSRTLYPPERKKLEGE